MAKPISVYELQAEEGRFFSPFCWASRLAIIHKEMPVETIPWKFREQDKIAFSGQGLVPVIVDANKDGKWVNDSWAIAKYLEATYPERPSLFGGSTGEAGALFVQKWFSSGPVVSLMKVIIPDLLKRQTPDIQPWFRETREAKFGVTLEEFSTGEKGVPEFQRLLEPIRQTLGEYPFLGGKAISYADIFIFSMFVFAYAVSPIKLLKKDDSIYEWRQRMFDAFSVTKTAMGYPESL